MPTYEVDIAGITYDVDAPDERTAWAWANQYHSKSSTQPNPELGSMVDEFGGSVGTSFLDKLRGVPAAMKEAFTGSERTTPEVEAAKNWRGSITQSGLPEFALTGEAARPAAALKTSAATLATTPKETADIISVNFPDIPIEQDAKGNFWYKSPSTGEWFVDKPGFRSSDILRVLGIGGMFEAGGAAVGVGKGAGLATRAAGAMAGETGLQAAKAVGGGEFSAEAIPLAGATELGIGALGKGIEAVNKLRKPMGNLGALESGGFGVSGGEGASIPAGEVAGAAERMAAGGSKAGATVESLSQNPDFISLVQRVADKDPNAIKEFSQLLDLNPEGVNAAARLGIELPPDIFSQSTQLKEAIGLGRSQLGSEQSAIYKQAIESASENATNALNEIGAKDVSEASANVLSKLQGARDELYQKGEELLTQVEIPKDTEILSSNLSGYLKQRLKNAKGDIKALTKGERELSGMIERGSLTWDTLLDQKEALRIASEGAGDYKGLGKWRLEQLREALRQDQILTAKNAVKDYSEPLVLGNKAWAEASKLDESIVKLFGRDENGSIATKIKTAISTGKGGDIRNLNLLIERVPEDLRSEVLLSGIMALTEGGTAQSAGKFGFTEYTKFFEKIKQKTEVYKLLRQNIGEDGIRVINDLNIVSKAISESLANLKKNGASLQFSDWFRTEGLLANMAEKAATPSGRSSMGAAVGGTVGAGITSFLGVGPSAGAAIGGLIGSSIGSSMGKIAKTPTEKGIAFMGAISTPEFKRIAVESATRKAISPKAIDKFIETKQFIKFAKETGIGMSKKARSEFVVNALKRQEDKKK